MLLSDIFYRIIIKSGQHLLHTENIELKDEAFKILVEDCLAVYNRSSPFDKTIQVDFFGSRSVTLEPDTELGRVPDWIAKATPVMTNMNSSVSQMSVDYAGRPSYGTFVPAFTPPVNAYFKYNKPVLVVNTSAVWDVCCVFSHRVELYNNEDAIGENIPVKKEYQIKTVTVDDDILFDLIHAEFLEGIGRSRRMFTMSDLPIVSDAESLIAEANEKRERANEALSKVQKFYLGI